MSKLPIDVKLLPHGEGLELPAYESAGAAGLDLRAALIEPIVLKAGQRALVPTGIAIALPAHHEGQVRPRSGLAVKHGLTVLNAPGTIDADYRGEIHVPMINLGQDDFTIERGMRIAQMVIAPIVQLAIKQVSALDDTDRGTDGFGSTGL